MTLASCIDKKHEPVLKKVVEPTCVAMGYTEYYCEHCGGTYYADYTNALGHDYADANAIGVISCTERTVYQSECKRCDATYRYSKAATGHTYIEVLENEDGITYECEVCHDVLILAGDEELEEFVGSEEIFDIDPSFVFSVSAEAGKDESYIRDNLTVLDSYFYGTEHEAGASVEYTLARDGANWLVAFPDGYEWGTTYIAKLSGDLEFVDYKGSELYFGIKDDPDHENEHQYKEGIVFLRALENVSAGYYPYEMNLSENSQYIYLTLGKADGISKGDTLCVGEVTEASQLTAEADVQMGKVEDVYEISSGKWMVVLSAPELSDVFDELDVIYSADVDFDGVEVDIEKLEADIADAFYKSEQFASLLGAVKLSAGRYLEDRGYHSSALKDTVSFMNGVEVNPKVNIRGNKLNAQLDGTITLDVKNESDEQVGTITVTFASQIESSFKVDAKYKTKRWGFFTLPSVNVSVRQKDDIEFDFGVAVDIEELETLGYVRNSDTGKVHLACCVEVTRANNPSVFEKISENQMSASSRKCTRCHPENGASLENDFNGYYVDTLYCSDWEAVVEDIKKITGASGEKEVNVSLASLDIPIGGTPVKLELGFGVCFGFDLGAIMDYSCEYSQTSIYGMRLNLDDVQAFSKREESDFEQKELAVIGSASVRTGISVDASIGIVGLEQCSAGIIADVGAYADVSGVLDGEKDIFGAYLETGAFYDVDAYYKLFILSDSIGIDADKYPVGKYGYDRLYFAYDVYRERLSVGESYDIAANDLLLVRYYDIKTMKIKTDELSLNESKKYKVTLSLEDGTNCEIRDGKIVVKNSAPELFMDTLTITVSAGDDWGEYSRGSSVYYLGTSYTIKLEFNRDHVHTWADATCEEPRTCKSCGAKDGEALGHAYTYVYNDDATCTENGTESATCTRCGNVDTRVVYGTAKGHEYKNYEIVTEATCTKDAIESATCVRCPMVDTRVVSNTAKGHAFGDYVANTEATCTRNATEIATCTTCGDTDVKSIAGTAFGHSFGAYVSGKEATCEENATKVRTCKTCGAEQHQEIEGTALGHNESDWIIDLEPTETTKGERHKQCTVCGVVLMKETIPATTSQGLSYELESNQYYVVTGIGTCTDTDIVIPTSYKGLPVKKIERYAFGGCEQITSVVISETITTVGANAFSGCDSLVSVFIGSSVKSLSGGSPFNGCTALTNIEVAEGNKYYKSVDGNLYSTKACTLTPGNTLMQYALGKTDKSFKVPEFVVGIDDEAFAYCTHLQTIELSDSVSTINNDAFYMCSSLISIIIPESVTNIGFSAFAGCESLVSIDIPKSVENIGNDVFDGCDSLMSINVDKDNPNYASVNGNLYSKDGSVLIVYANGKNETSFIVPDSVKTIFDGAFAYNNNLVDVQISDSVTVIESNAFFCCEKLERVILGESVTSIGAFAFSTCLSLKEINIPDSVERIEAHAFGWCSSLRSIVLGNNLKKIGEFAFETCSKLRSITIPQSIESIDQYAFLLCENVDHIYFDGTIEQWKAIFKEENWNNMMGEYTVHCSNGDLVEVGAE